MRRYPCCDESLLSLFVLTGRRKKWVLDCRFKLNVRLKLYCWALAVYGNTLYPWGSASPSRCASLTALRNQTWLDEPESAEERERRILLLAQAASGTPPSATRLREWCVADTHPLERKGYSLQTSRCRKPVTFVVMPARIAPSAIAGSCATHRLMWWFTVTVERYHVSSYVVTSVRIDHFR